MQNTLQIRAAESCCKTVVKSTIFVAIVFKHLEEIVLGVPMVTQEVAILMVRQRALAPLIIMIVPRG